MNYMGHFLTYWKLLISKEHNITQNLMHISRWHIVSSATLTKELSVQGALHLNRSDNGVNKIDIFGVLLCKPQVLHIYIGSNKTTTKKEEDY